MAENKGFIKNMELLAYHDLNDKPGFQMAMQQVGEKYYLYVATYKHAGWHILEVTDPAKPRYVRFLKGPDFAGQTTPKIQIAEGIMICALGGSLPFLHGTKWTDPYIEGVYIWDVKDPENPNFLSHWSTGMPNGMGVHRFFYNGGPYVHLAASCKGFSTLIYRILDISDPTHPCEVGRWWYPEQFSAGYPKQPHVPIEQMLDAPGLHAISDVKGNYAYCAWGSAGLIILDISDVTRPQFVGQLKQYPIISGGLGGARCHTTIALSQKPFVVMTTEGERFSCFNKKIVDGKAQPMNMLAMVDVKDVTKPTMVSMFPYPEVPAGYPYKNFNILDKEGTIGPFGPHNIHEPHDCAVLEDRNDRIYCCYFHAGLRIYDISDLYVPKEIAYFIPPDPTKWCFNNEEGNLYPGPRIAITEDVIVDNRGIIYMDTFHDGLYILRSKV